MSFWRTYYHLVWATKNREPLINPEVEPRLFTYTVHKAAELGAYVYAINGWNDHLHLLASIPPHLSVAALVKHLKGASSHDLNQYRPDEHFEWQGGYGVLTLGQRQRADAEAYVRRQKEHHARQTAIAWLETYSEQDDGPPDRADVSASPVPALHDERVLYVASSEDPAF